MKPASSLQALLATTVDYAGLFPPAGLELEPSLKNYASYLRTGDAWMLSRFVLPVGQFKAAVDHLALFTAEYPLRVSALGLKTQSTDDFFNALEEAAKAIRRAHETFGEMFKVEQFEMPAPNGFGQEDWRRARSILGDWSIQTFWETAPLDAPDTIAQLGENNSYGAGRAFGYKLRSGGVVADAFPAADVIAAALCAAIAHRVPIKFTAGLHHPVRRYHESVQTKMHGFLNVFGAGVLAAEHNWNEAQVAEMLEDENPANFQFEGELFRWRKTEISADRIAHHRALITSFGSCSFDEPREDLNALRLL